MTEGPSGSPIRRLGLLGGTFDPPHNGHVAVAAIVRHALALDEVWLVVANRPWQKVDQRPVTPAEIRWALVQAAVAGVSGIRACRLELDRGGDTYTADTLAELRAASPECELYLVVGADAAAGLMSWKRPDDVRAGATVVVVDRPGAASPDPPEGWTFERVVAPRLDISSSDVRRRRARGEPVDGLVPPAVASLIAERDLYRGVEV